MLKLNVSWLLLAMANHVPPKGTCHSLPPIPFLPYSCSSLEVDGEFPGLLSQRSPAADPATTCQSSAVRQPFVSLSKPL